MDKKIDKKLDKKKILKLMQEPKIIAVILFCLFISAAAGYYFWKKSQYVLYQNKISGIEIKYPKRWSVIEGQDGAVVAFLSPQEGELDLFRENVNIAIENLGSRRIVLREYAAIAIRQLQGTFKQDVQMISSEQAYMATRPAHQLVYILNVTFPLKITHIWVFNKDKVYTLTFTAEVTTFDKYYEQIQEMIQSFNIIKAN